MLKPKRKLCLLQPPFFDIERSGSVAALSRPPQEPGFSCQKWRCSTSLKYTTFLVMCGVVLGCMWVVVFVSRDNISHFGHSHNLEIRKAVRTLTLDQNRYKRLDVLGEVRQQGRLVQVPQLKKDEEEAEEKRFQEAIPFPAPALRSRHEDVGESEILNSKLDIHTRKTDQAKRKSKSTHDEQHEVIRAHGRNDARRTADGAHGEKAIARETSHPKNEPKESDETRDEDNDFNVETAAKSIPYRHRHRSDNEERHKMQKSLQESIRRSNAIFKELQRREFSKSSATQFHLTNPGSIPNRGEEKLDDDDDDDDEVEVESQMGATKPLLAAVTKSQSGKRLIKEQVEDEALQETISEMVDKYIDESKIRIELYAPRKKQTFTKSNRAKQRREAA